MARLVEIDTDIFPGGLKGVGAEHAFFLCYRKEQILSKWATYMLIFLPVYIMFLNVLNFCTRF